MALTSSNDVHALSLARSIKLRAMEVGFDLVGITDASPSRHADHFRRWLDDGYAGSMTWLENRINERIDPGTYFPGAASVICLAMNYHAPLVAADSSAQTDHARIARYALGDDYHEVLKKKLYALADWMAKKWPETQTRCGVDTAPIMERELAARAGVGWIGKNTCVIHPRVGSWIFLAEIITNLPLPPDEPMADHCGTCTRCIDACPTGAIVAPYRLDSRRCISYLTIEHRHDIPQTLREAVGQWLYGCDICQEVCPHNRSAPAVIADELQPRFPTGGLNAADVLKWTDDDYRTQLRHSAIKRVKLPILRRNAQIVLENLWPDPHQDTPHFEALPGSIQRVDTQLG